MLIYSWQHINESNFSMQIYSFSLKWMLLNKDWIDLQAINMCVMNEFLPSGSYCYVKNFFLKKHLKLFVAH